MTFCMEEIALDVTGEVSVGPKRRDLQLVVQTRLHLAEQENT